MIMKNSLFKRVLSLALAAVTALSLAACGGGKSGSGSQAGGGQDVVDGVKQNLTIGVTSLWSTLSPFQGNNAQYANFVRAIYDRMGVFYNGECIKQAAESWEVAEDGVTWTVKIKDGLIDTADNKITADDMVWYIEESIDRALKPQFNKVASVLKVDDLTFQVVMKSDVVGSFELVMASTYVVSRAAFEASDDEFADSVVSTSPYEVVEFVSGSHLTLKKRDDYWNADSQEAIFQNNAENVTFQVISEPSQQQVALETGTVDAFESVTASLIPNFEGRDDYGLITNLANNGVQMYFSGDAGSPVANDVNLRKAIAHAIDINGLITTALEGRADALHDPAGPNLMGYVSAWDEEEYFPYDTELSAEYLAQSDYNGETLYLMSASFGSYSRVCQALQGYLLAAGINCELKLVDNAMFTSTLFDGSQYDMILVSAGGMTITNLWSNRFDMNAYANGDATGRRDEVLTNMIYNTWTQAGFTDENITSVHNYLKENCIAYGLYIPWCDSVYRTESRISEAPVGASGAADFVAADFQ